MVAIVRKKHAPGRRIRNQSSAAIIGLVCGIAAFLILSAHESRAETIQQALAAAFAGNPGLDAERLRQKADEEFVRQAWGKFLPAISLEAEKGKEDSRTTPGTSQRTKPEGYGVTLTQPLFRGFRTYNGTRKAKAEVQAGQFQLSDREQEVLLDTITAYADVLRDRRILELRQSNISYLETELKASTARFRAGDLTRTDVAQARARLHEGKADLVEAEADLAASSARYEAVIGHAPGGLAPAAVPVTLIPASLAEAYAAADADNPEIGGARQQAEAANRAKLQAYGALMPDLSLELSQTKSFGDLGSVDHEDESAVFLRLNMPLFAGDRRSKIRQSAAQESRRNLEILDSRRRIRAAVTDAWQHSLADRERI
ncbi:MAG: TolC family protein, partial [Pseudomonadota bacterium]|nr:TolC family protein [Pseudomonadota bacterium]